MQKLHLVGFTSDLDGLIFSTRRGSKSGAYVVPLDDGLIGAIEEAQRRAEDEEAEAVHRSRTRQPRSRLSVKDIQARLRAGRSLTEVAQEAGADEAWVARFAAPVLAEQAAIVERARTIVFGTPRKGVSSRPLGEAVRWNLADRGVFLAEDEYGAGWSAFQVAPGRWALRFVYTSRNRQQVAEWEVDLDEEDLAARNRLASDLAYVEPGAKRPKLEPVKPPAPLTKAPPPEPDPKHPGRKGTPARSTTARAQAAKAASAKAAANRSKATAKAKSVRKPARPAAKQAQSPARSSASSVAARPGPPRGSSSSQPARPQSESRPAPPPAKAEPSARPAPAKEPEVRRMPAPSPTAEANSFSRRAAAGDGRSPILVIRAERAGARRRSP